MSREKALVKNTAIISIGTFLPKVVSFITLPIVTAGLTQIEYGTYDLITILVSFFLPMVTLQIQAAAFRFLLDYRENKEETDRVITNVFLFVISVSFFSLVLLFFILSFLSMAVRLLICLYFFCDILVLSARQIVRGLDNNMLYSFSAVLESALNMILIVSTIKIGGGGITALMFSLTTATMAGLLILLIKGNFVERFDLSLADRALLFEMLHYSLPLVPHVLSDWILRLSDRIVITTFMGLEATAIYAVANKIPAILTLVQNTFSYAWQENASLASNDVDEDIYYTQMFQTVAKILSGATALLIAVTPVIFKILVKGDYEEAYRQMPILLLGMFFSIYSAFIGGIYVAHKKTKNMALTTMAAAGINLILDLLLINQLGIYAASISTLCSYIFLMVYRMWDIRKSHKIIYKIKQLILYIFMMIVMCFLCWFTDYFANCIQFIIASLFATAVNKELIIKIIRNLLRKKS